MKSLLLRYMKANWAVDDFKRGKTRTAKKRFVRSIKRRAKTRLQKDLELYWG